MNKVEIEALKVLKADFARVIEENKSNESVTGALGLPGGFLEEAQMQSVKNLFKCDSTTDEMNAIVQQFDTLPEILAALWISTKMKASLEDLSKGQS